MHQFHKFILSWNSTWRTVRLSIIRSLLTVHSAMLYVIQVCRLFSSRTRVELVPSWSCSIAVYKPVWHILLLSVQLINSWWWTDELSETYRVSWQNKFAKLVHLVGFITKKPILYSWYLHAELAHKFWTRLFKKLVFLIVLIMLLQCVMQPKNNGTMTDRGVEDRKTDYFNARQ
jgi:hypothetical protein